MYNSIIYIINKIIILIIIIIIDTFSNFDLIIYLNNFYFTINFNYSF